MLQQLIILVPLRRIVLMHVIFSYSKCDAHNNFMKKNFKAKCFVSFSVKKSKKNKGMPRKELTRKYVSFCME